MNWQKQMEEMVSAWTETQRSFWESWSEAVEKSGLPFPGGMVEQQYRRNLEAWQRSVEEALERQREWARTWSGEGLAEAPARQAAERWATQVQEMMQSWTEAQSRLWQAWFENVQRQDAGALGAQWEQQARAIMEAWQEAATNAQGTLAQWGRSAGGEPGGERSRTERGAAAAKDTEAPKGKPAAASSAAAESATRSSSGKSSRTKTGGAASGKTSRTGTRRRPGGSSGSKKGS